MPRYKINYLTSYVITIDIDPIKFACAFIMVIEDIALRLNFLLFLTLNMRYLSPAEITLYACG